MLSVIAQQIMTICNALKIGAEKFEFFGEFILLDTIFVLFSRFIVFQAFGSSSIFSEQYILSGGGAYPKARKSGSIPIMGVLSPWILVMLDVLNFLIISRHFFVRWLWWYDLSSVAHALRWIGVYDSLRKEKGHKSAAFDLCCTYTQVPDYALIAEIMLFSEGFGDSLTLARKQVDLHIYG